MSTTIEKFTRVRMLAASPSPIAEVLIDALRRANKPTAGHSLTDLTGQSHQLALSLDGDEPADVLTDDAAQVLRPLDVAAAVLLGRALNDNRPRLARLQDSDSVTIIEVPTTDLVAPVAQLLRHEIIGIGAIMDGADLRAGTSTVVAPGTVAFFRDPDNGKTTKHGDGNAEIAAAVQRRCAIVGVSVDADRLLPRDLVRLADVRIGVPRLDGGAIAEVIAAVTGRHPGRVDQALASRVTPDSLNLAVRADLGAERSLARLERILGGADWRAATRPCLSEMHGLGAAKQWGLDLAADLRAYVAGRLPWRALPPALLICGAPGTGKTSFARALSVEAGVHFIATSYADWQSYKDGHLGTVTQAIRRTFAEARQKAPCIVFIDEIDTIPARGSGKWNDDWWTAITNCLLEELDGFERREGVVVIAACNNPDRLDAALVRAGRLDRRIEIPLPDVPALIGIFRSHLGDDLQGVDLRAAALAARGHTGADVERWVRDARGRARRDGGDLTLALLLDAVRGGVPELPPAIRQRIGYHEAGHAIANLVLGVADPVALTINAAGGLTQAEFGEMQALTRSHLEQYLVVLLAGRAAEELVYGDTTAGAGGSEDSDLGRATLLALRLESSYGLGASGLLWMAPGSAHDLVLHRDLRQAVGATLDQAYAAAKELLAANRASLDALAEALIAHGYLDQAEIVAVLARVPLGTARTIGSPVVEAPLAEAVLGDRDRPADTGDDQSLSTILDALAPGSAEA